MALVTIKSNSELEKEAQAEQAIRDAAITASSQDNVAQFTNSLVGYLRGKWDMARRAKITKTEMQMIANLRQSLGMYDPKKLAAIRNMGAGSDVNLNETGVKCFNALAWINDIEFISHGKCWGVKPTPVADIDPEIMAKMKQTFAQSALGSIAQKNGGIPDLASVMSGMKESDPETKTGLLRIAQDYAEEMAQLVENELEDKLVEGKWYEAFSACLYDLVYIKTGFIKGPMKRQRMQPSIENDQASGKKKVVYKLTEVDEFERRSPFDIYPEPDSTGINDGYLFDHVAFRHKDLYALRGVDGFKTTEIDAVMLEFQQGGLREWTGIEAERALLENRDTQSVYNSDKIEGLEFYGSVPGTLLLEWGMSLVDVPEPARHYEIRACMIDKHIIQAVLNPDPLGRKPYSKASYEEQNDSFWGRALPEKIAAPASVINAAVRALVNNLAMGSGPQVEINIDRLIGGDKGDTRLTPWRRWLTHNKQQQTGKAIEFFQPNMHAQEISNIIKDFTKILDEHGGIPGYAHGDSQVGGAGNTASGLSMLITQASRAIKNVIRNIDQNIIVPTIQYLYDSILHDPSGKFLDIIGDIKLVAKGITALIEKEQRAVRMLELIGASENPYAAQVIGSQGFKYLWGEVARSYDMEPAKVVTGQANVNQAAPGTEASQTTGAGPGGAAPDGGSSPGGTKESPATLNTAGATPSGADTQLITGQGGHPALPPGPVAQ